MLLARVLAQLVKVGQLTVIDSTGKARVFEGEPGPVVTIRITDPAAARAIALHPNLCLGEAYMEGKLVVEDGGTLYDLLDLFGHNLARFGPHPFAQMQIRVDRVFRFLQQYNPMSRARANVSHHYDLSGRLYDLFLDHDRQYSCAYFPHGGEDLETAQDLKKRHIAAKLLMSRNQKVLDIGSGWGGMGLYLAREMNADVTGVTLSTEQFNVSNARAQKARLSNRARFELKDYRLLEGTFDRIVSVGMFEHVGVYHYRTFFEKIRDLLDDNGVALLHTIGRMEGPGTTNPWIRKYIFPGGYIPALSEVSSAIEKAGLWITDIEILRLHYAETLRHWRQRFMGSWDEAAEIYDERFCRMWEFYLAASEISFRHLRNCVFQIQLTKRQEAVPLTRDYITDWDRDLVGKSRHRAA